MTGDSGKGDSADDVFRQAVMFPGDKGAETEERPFSLAVDDVDLHDGVAGQGLFDVMGVPAAMMVPRQSDRVR